MGSYKTIWELFEWQKSGWVCIHQEKMFCKIKKKFEQIKILHPDKKYKIQRHSPSF